jgi:hypothetical protein
VLIPGADSNQIASTGITLTGGEIGCFGNPCSVGFPDLVSGQTGRSKTILGQWRYPPYCSPSRNRTGSALPNSSISPRLNTLLPANTVTMALPSIG